MEKMIEDPRSELAGKMSRFTILKNGKKIDCSLSQLLRKAFMNIHPQTF